MPRLHGNRDFTGYLAGDSHQVVIPFMRVGTSILWCVLPHRLDYIFIRFKRRRRVVSTGSIPIFIGTTSLGILHKLCMKIKCGLHRYSHFNNINCSILGQVSDTYPTRDFAQFVTLITQTVWAVTIFIVALHVAMQFGLYLTTAAQWKFEILNPKFETISIFQNSKFKTV